MTRIEQEKRIVRKLIELYCRHHLHQDTMPDEYLHLADFAPEYLYDISTALDPYGPNEPTPQVAAEP